MNRAVVAGTFFLLLLALGATASGASAAKLTLSEGGVALAPGETIYAEKGRIEVETSNGPIECSFVPEVDLTLSVVTNSKTRDELGINRLSERQETCRSFTGNAEIHLESLGSFVKVTAEGKSIAGLYPTLKLLFEHVEYQGTRYEGVECVYRRERLPGTNTATPNLQALQIAFEGKLRLRPLLSSAKAGHLCPAEANLSISLPLIESETAVIEEQTST
jgi:hypothetical protein